MIVPIWAASWELDCCQPEAEVAAAWSVPLAFAAIGRLGGPQDPWRELTAALPTERQRGVVELDILRLSPIGEPCPLWGAGPLRFLGHGLNEGRHVGRLGVDAHHTDDDDIECPDRDVFCDGVVEAVHLVPIRYVRVGRRDYEPAEQLPAIPVASTRHRSEIDDEPEGQQLINAELLITLRLKER